MRVELHAFTVTLGPSYDNIQMLEDDEELKVTVTGTRNTLDSWSWFWYY